MKKLSCCFLVLFLMVGTSFSQGLLGKGVKVGLNMAKLTGDDVQNAKYRTGFAAGGYLNFGLGMFAVQPEVLFSMQGSKFDVEENLEMKLNYIEVPVLLKVGVGLAGPVKPHVLVGPSLGILLSAKAKWQDDGESVENDIKDELKSTDFRIVFGAGIDTMVGLSVDARWSMGMTTLDDAGDNREDFKNSVISLTVGYGF
jgi:hypothetical protein